MTARNPDSAAPSPDNRPRLDSWKEIAAYCKRDVRTVRRWEAAQGLPVHRHRHNERDSVYAFTDEIDTWWNAKPRDNGGQPAPVRPSGRAWWVAAAVLVVAAGLYGAVRVAHPWSAWEARTRLAVLPFDSPAGDAGTEPIGDMVAEDVISRLGQLGPDTLAVVAGTSARSYRGSKKRAGEIGRELNVAFLVEGTARRSLGDRLLVDVRLVQARDDTLLRVWQYDRPSADLAGLADEVASSVATTVGIDVAAVRPATAARARSSDPEAYALFLRGQYHLARRTGGREMARQYLEQATARDPRFAAAHAALGEAYLRLALYEPEVRANAWASAEASAKRALALDETLPAGHVTLAAIRLYRDWDWRSARSEYQRAIDLDAGDSGARTGYAVYLRAAGRMGEAIAQLRKALETDPLNVPLATALGGDYLLARKYDDAIREFQRALELEPEYWPAVRDLADAYERKGLEEQALAQTMKLFTGRGPKELTEFERVCRSQGYQAAARWLDRRQIEQYSRNADANAYNLAFSYARLGDKDNAFRFLEAAYRLRDANLLQLRVDPDMDGLRSDPRYGDLLRRMGAMP